MLMGKYGSVIRMLAVLLFALVAASEGYSQVSYYRDANDSWEGSNDYEFNRINRGDYGMTLDGVFIKNDIGIDRYYEVSPDTTDTPVRYPFWIRGIGSRNDSLRVEAGTKDADINVGGVKCDMGLYHLRYSKQRYRLLSLDEVRRKYFPKLKGDVVYMINKFFIMTNADLYKLDEDFIHHVELVDSKDFDALKHNGRFHVLRIFTRTAHNQVTGMGRGYDLEKALDWYE